MGMKPGKRQFPLLSLLLQANQYQVFEEFAMYQCAKEVKTDSQRIDKMWQEIGKVKDECGVKPYWNISMVMRGILVIPHSSAHCERVFSTVRKNRTDQ
jgi:hypothetical protein